jgi:hypothetical protein
MKVDVARLQANVDRAHQSGYVVREMRSQDAGDIALVHVQVWHQAYADLMPAEFLAAMDIQASTDRWRELLAAHRSTIAERAHRRAAA